MKPIPQRSIFNSSLLLRTKCSPLILGISQHSLFSSLTPQNSISGYPQRRHEEESRSIRVSVWWDFENCNLPCNSNVFRVAQCITNAIRANGIKGSIQITAFGDVMQISRTNQEALSSTGINLTHVPSGGKNSADRSLLVDLMYWVSHHPPPAHLFLISGDRDFAGILHRLRMNNYNILLASPDSAPSVLCGAATIMWLWSDLLRGENLIGKHFNQPPDGPYGSWYGHYKAPLEDPFAVAEQKSYLKSVEFPESSPEKVRPIPKAVTKYINHVLASYPSGIHITQLHVELMKSNFTIDKDLYGYKKFSRFLSAMPHVLKLQQGNDGSLFVHSVNHKTGEVSVQPINVETATNVAVESEIGSDSKRNAEKSSAAHLSEKSSESLLESRMIDDASNLRKSEKKESLNESYLNLQDVKAKLHAADLQVTRKEERQIESTPPTYIKDRQRQDKKVNLQQLPKNIELASVKDNREKNQNQLHAIIENGSTAESGIFRKKWMTWFVRNETSHNEKNCHKVDEIPTEKDMLVRRSALTASPALFSPSSHEALINGTIPRNSAFVTCPSSQETSLFYHIVRWCKVWGSHESDDTTAPTCERADQTKFKYKQPDVLSQESFWSEIESFLVSSEGSVLFSQSRTREHLAQNLQKQGPSVLRSLSEGDLIHLVDLLISDKKWVVEGDTQSFPFKLTRLAGKDMRNNRPLSSNGLSQMFTLRQPILQELGDRKHQNPPHTGVPQTSSHKGFYSKPRNEILVDCRKLVNNIVKEYPEGFNIGSFRKLFLEKHGYALDLKKLGYEKLVNLLELMPGVRIDSNIIFPVKPDKDPAPYMDPTFQENKIDPAASSDGESDDSDSWDELGPINHPSFKKEEIDSEYAGIGQMKQREQSLPDYEPLKEEYFSDSEDEKPIKPKSEGKLKTREEESSLLQILDSWYSDKEGDERKDELEKTEKVGNDKKDGSVNISNRADSSENFLQPCTLASSRHSMDPALSKHARKLKPKKNYSFVLERVDSKNKLVDDMLGSLKKIAREPC